MTIDGFRDLRKTNIQYTTKLPRRNTLKQSKMLKKYISRFLFNFFEIGLLFFKSFDAKAKQDKR